MWQQTIVRQPKDWGPVHWAVWNHDHDLLQSIVQSDNVDSQDSYGCAPLHLACTSRDSPFFNKHRWDRDERPAAPLPDTSIENEISLSTLGILLQKGANINSETMWSFTPLDCAVLSGWVDHATALINAGARLCGSTTCTPLCKTNGTSIAMRQLLQERFSSAITTALQSHQQVQHAAILGGDGASYDKNHAPASDHGQVPDDVQQSKPRHKSWLLLSKKRLFTKRTSKSKGTSVNTINSRISTVFSSSDSERLCSVCSRISLKELCNHFGYLHPRSMELATYREYTCPFCRAISKFLSQHQICDSFVTLRIVPELELESDAYTSNEILCSLNIMLSPFYTCITGLSGRLVDPAKLPQKKMETKPDLGSDWQIGMLTIGLYVAADTEAVGYNIEKGIQLNADLLSEASISIFRGWLTNCAVKHSHCRPKTHSFMARLAPMPTRVLDVDVNGDNDEIHLMTTDGMKGKYAALSHRWVSGKQPEWVTKKATLHQRINGFSLQELPKSLVDAVIVTRKLGLRYLWIDSVCILQDCAQDWLKESMKMVDVYSNAHITISADCAFDDNAGFLRLRQIQEPEPISIPIDHASRRRISIHLRQASKYYELPGNKNGRIKREYFTSEEPNEGAIYKANIEQSVLNSRGWILQERIMSPRILHFGTDQVFWECRTTACAEDGHRFHQERQRKWLAEAHQVLMGTAMSPYELHYRWMGIIEIYSKRHLSQNDDKLPAIAGVAKAFSPRIGGVYLAGLWKNYLHVHLLWRTLAPSAYSLPSRQRTYRAPSWSWASTDTPIIFEKCDPGKSKPAFEVTDVGIDTFGENPFGRCRSGFLKVIGRLVPGVNEGPGEKIFGSDRRFNGISAGCKLSGLALMDYDTVDDIGIKDVVFFEVDSGADHFLVLVPDSQQEGCYRRIGLGHGVLSREQDVNMQEFTLI